MIFETTILGTSSAVTAHGRSLTAQVLQAGNHLYLIDCGEGTQFQLAKYGIRSSLLRCIFISHLHGDHYYGLMGLLTTMSLKGRETPLTIFGPAGLGEAIALHLRLSGSVLSYELIFQPIEAGAERRIYEDHHVTVDVVPLAHKIPCSGFIFRENPKQRRLIGDKMPPGLSSEHINMLKSGEDVVFMGEILHWEDMTLPPKPSRSYAFCSDTTYIPALAAKIGQVDVLYHEATYMADQTAKAMEHFHSTTAQAGQVAADAGVKALIIGHYSSRYADLQPLLHEAQRVFPNTYLAIEGQRYGMQWEEEGYVWYSKGTYHDIQ